MPDRCWLGIEYRHRICKRTCDMQCGDKRVFGVLLGVKQVSRQTQIFTKIRQNHQNPQDSPWDATGKRARILIIENPYLPGRKLAKRSRKVPDRCYNEAAARLQLSAQSAAGEKVA